MPIQTEIHYGLIAGSILLLMVAFFVPFIIIRSRKRQIESERSIEKMQAEYERTLLKTQLEIQEQTLKNISQEIHDNIGQALTLAKLNLNAVMAEDAQLQEKILNSKELVSKAITDLRDLSHSLDTDYVLEMGFQRSIEYELELIRKTGLIRTDLRVEGNLQRLERQNELILFRIVQESFNNILKHAEAELISVELLYGTENLLVTVADNGRGMDTKTESERGSLGIGLRNMRNRASLIGASFELISTEGKGTRVIIQLPLNKTL